jgi:hypothetical protein
MGLLLIGAGDMMMFNLIQYRFFRKLIGGSYYQITTPHTSSYWTDKEPSMYINIRDEVHYIKGRWYNKLSKWQKEKTQRRTELIEQDGNGGVDVHYQATVSQDRRVNDFLNE